MDKNRIKKLLDSIDQEKLEEAVDNLMYVQRESQFAIFPENPKDMEPFLLKLLKDSIDVLIANYVDKDMERAIFYGLIREVKKKD